MQHVNSDLRVDLLRHYVLTKYLNMKVERLQGNQWHTASVATVRVKEDGRVRSVKQVLPPLPGKEVTQTLPSSISQLALIVPDSPTEGS